MQQSSAHSKPDSAISDNQNISTPVTGQYFASQRVFNKIPLHRPVTPLLNQINSPDDLKQFTNQQLIALVDELREFLLYCAGQSGGHFGANLGVVELTIALHYLLDTPVDKLVWDVGHQAYAHKALTGRREQLTSIRSKNGLTAFPERAESKYDMFGVGHSSTAISAGLGMSLALRHKNSDASVACVVGDGAMTGGMAFEAMNDAVQQNADLLVILNDNDMSISCSTGGFSRHLAKLWESGYQVDITDNGSAKLRHRPDMRFSNSRARHNKLHNIPKVEDNLFRAIGFKYFGPFDGHNLPELLRVLTQTKKLSGPVLVHIYTTKGKGFKPAEIDPVKYHAIGKLPIDEAKAVLTQVSLNNESQPKRSSLKYSQVFGQFICDTAAIDPNLIAITPAMEEGSGMTQFASKFADRFFDVAIAEQHAVTLAGGMATQGVKPIVAIYSTFLQRGYDQLIHDIALQNLNVMFAIDRAGLVGEDGATHAGVFDLAFMRCVPNMVIAVPKDENECYQLLNTCYEYDGVTAVRYPRGTGEGVPIIKPAQIYTVGKAVIEHEFKGSGIQSNNPSSRQPKLALLAFGPMVAIANKAASMLTEAKCAHITVVNMRWVKPLDTALLDDLITTGMTHIVTLEEHTVIGGGGSAINEYLLNSPHQLGDIRVKNIGIPDTFINHGSHEEQLAECHLDVKGVISQIQQWI